MYSVYLNYCTPNLTPLMVYPKVLFRPKSSIKALTRQVMEEEILLWPCAVLPQRD